MARANESWERLVTAVLRDEDVRLTALRTPSDISVATSSDSSPPQLPSFTHHHILRATNGLSASNLIKQGLSGDFFYGCLDDGTPVVVKKIDISSAKKKSLLRSELEVAEKHSHSRLVSFLGHCLELRDRKFLVYDFMSNGDLSRCLFGGSSTLLDWRTRLKIAIGVAESLCYLHHECVPPLVHRNIEASSILLDANFDVRLGSLYDLCAEGKHINQHGIYKPLRLRKLYRMLLAKGTMSNAMRVFDVYCFGRILLELITGKLGYSASNDSSFMEWAAHLLAFIVPENPELILDIMVPSLIIDSHDLIEVWGVALVAKACLRLNSSEQPQMSNVLLALQYIESARFRYNSRDDVSVNPVIIADMVKGFMILGISSGATANSKAFENTLTHQKFLEPRDCVESCLNEEMLHDHKLMNPSFSKLMDAQWNITAEVVERLVDGNRHEFCLQEAVSVKVGSGSVISLRIYSSRHMQRVNGWKGQAGLLRRLSHPNLVKLVGYFSKDKRLVLIHEVVQNGSLKDQFNGAAAKLLSMETRLKILIGAARGLAFLHANEKRGFYEYFETSDIYLDNSYNATLLGFGTTKVDHPNAYDDMALPMRKCVYEAPEFCRYAAPEGFTTERILKGMIPIANDVYGFGVVMFDVLTGVLTDQRFDTFMFVDVSGSRFIKSKQIERIIDDQLKGERDARTARKLASLALKCTATDVEARPSMGQVAGKLELINLRHRATI